MGKRKNLVDCVTFAKMCEEIGYDDACELRSNVNLGLVDINRLEEAAFRTESKLEYAERRIRELDELEKELDRLDELDRLNGHLSD